MSETLPNPHRTEPGDIIGRLVDVLRPNATVHERMGAVTQAWMRLGYCNDTKAIIILVLGLNMSLQNTDSHAVVRSALDGH